MMAKSTWLLLAFLVAACGRGTAYNVSRTGGSSAVGSGGRGTADGGPSGSGGAAGATTIGGRTSSGGVTSSGTGGAGTGGAGAGTGGAGTGGAGAGTGTGGAGTGGAGSFQTGGASAMGGVIGDGGATGGTTGQGAGGVAASGGTSGGLVSCNSSDGSGCGDPTFCIDTRSDGCWPDSMSGCTGLCATRRRTPSCAGLAPTTPCPDGFACLPDARTYLGPDPASVCVGADTRECSTNGDCPTGFVCVSSAGGSRCSPDKTVCEDYVTCKMAQPDRCPAGYARSTPDKCFGPCVPVELCTCSTDFDCGPAGAVCDRTQGRCYFPTAPEPRCQLAFDIGPCDAVVQVYAFIDGECQPVSYGGCGGNDNRFAKLEECRSRCEGMPGDKPCPEGTAERVVCLGCGGGGGCLQYANLCAKTCTTRTDCQPTGLSCVSGFCEIGVCV